MYDFTTIRVRWSVVWFIMYKTGICASSKDKSENVHNKSELKKLWGFKMVVG